MKRILLVACILACGSLMAAPAPPVVVRPCTPAEQRLACPPVGCGPLLKWDASTGATKYRVRRRWKWGFIWNDKIIETTRRQFDLRDFGSVSAGGRDYEIAVGAGNVLGWSGWSDDDIWWRMPKAGQVCP